MISKVTPEIMAADAAAFFDYLAARPEVSGDGVRHHRATAWAGAPRWWSPAGCPGGWRRRCRFHGGGLAADDAGSPHLLADKMRAAVYVGAAENDQSFTAEQGETLDKALTAAGVEHTIEFYPAAHGFAVPDNAPYDEAAAERHWAAMKDTFGAHLA